MNNLNHTHNKLAHWQQVCIVAVIIFILYLIIGSRSTLWDRDEPRFSRAAVEMIESGNYLYPTFNGELRPHKPILIYWLMSLPVRLLGPTELACRFWSAIGTVITCLLTYVITRRLCSPRAGLWAMIILASSLMILIIGNFATADGVLLPCMTAAMAVFVFALPQPRPLWRNSLLMGLALAGALLVKGPVGLLPVLVMLTTLIILRKSNIPIKSHLFIIFMATLIGTALFLAWGIPANIATEGRFLQLGIGHHVVERSATPLENHGGNFFLFLPYYIPVVIFGFFPWIAFLPAAVSAGLAARIAGQKGKALLLGWTVPIFIVMTLVMTKLPHYVLFMWPPLAIAVAVVLHNAASGALTDRDKIWLKRGIWFFLVPAVTGSLGFIVGPWFLPLPALRWYGLAAGLILLAATITAVRFQNQLQIFKTSRTLVLGMILVQAPFLFGMMPQIEKLKISPAVVEIIKNNAAPDTPVVAHKYIEPTMIFYLGRSIEDISRKDIPDWASTDQPGILVIHENAWKKLLDDYGRPPLKKIGTVKGMNFGNLKYRTVFIYQRLEGQE